MELNPRGRGLLSVDLRAIRQNWKLVAKRLQKGAHAGAVIKANAYGLGAREVGRSLFQAGCRDFFVANLDEALSARQYLPDEVAIYVLGGAPAGEEALLMERRLIPVLYSLPSVQRWYRACQHSGQPSSAALKLDTGMNRLGLTPSEIDQLLNDPEYLKASGVALFMSHLACADTPEDLMNRQQLEQFRRAFDRLRRQLPGVRGSLANSSGVFLGEDYHFDLVRPGASLYGFSPQPGIANPMHPVVKLRLPVLQIRRVERSGTVGYGGTGRVSAPARLAVVAGGYADGVHRLIGPEGVARVGGNWVPVVGRISMDLTTFDISALPSGESNPEWVELLGNEVTVNDRTQQMGALGYEVLTSLGSRYQRQYLE